MSADKKTTEEKDDLDLYFEDCFKWKKGVMPYYGGGTIKFVWHNQGYGRICTLTLRKNGVEVAKKYYEALCERNAKFKKCVCRRKKDEKT